MWWWHRQHVGCHKTSCVNSFGTKMQHRQHFEFGQYWDVMDVYWIYCMGFSIYIFSIGVNLMRHVHKCALQVQLFKFFNYMV